jgi:hypothetical protein
MSFSRFVVVVNTKKFFQVSWNLIESENARTRQYVIIKIDAKTRLAIIKTVTNIMNVSQKNETIVSIFKNTIFFFYKIISHSNVLFSLILKIFVDIIYIFLFDLNDRRDLNVFRFTAAVLSEMMLSYSSSDEKFFIIVIWSSLAVLDRLIEMNQSVQIIEDFIAILKTIFVCFLDNFMIWKAKQNLTRIKRRLNIDFSLFLASIQLISQNLLSAIFELSEDLLENLFNDDIRHDNDHANIVDIQILFIAQEIFFFHDTNIFYQSIQHKIICQISSNF